MVHTILMYKYFVVSPDGNIVAKLPNPSVSPDLLKEIYLWKKSGASNDDVLDRLRLRCVPTGYIPKPWNPGVMSL